MSNFLARLAILCAASTAALSMPAVAGAQAPDDPVENIFLDERPFVDLTGWRIAFRDSSVFSEPAYDDGKWDWDKGIGLWTSEGRSGKGVRWYRKAVSFPEAPEPLDMLALYEVAAVSACEVYWDGALIARSGRVGLDRAGEKPGLSAMLVAVPSTLAGAGVHQIALRMSNQHSICGLVEEPFRLAHFSYLRDRLFWDLGVSLFLAGIFFVTAFFHLAILLGRGNKWTYVFFSVFCLSCAAYILIRCMVRYFQIDLTHYYAIATVNDIPWLLMMTLLPVFLLFEFTFPMRIRLSAFVAALGLCIVSLPRMVTFRLLPIGWLSPLDAASRMHAILTIALALGISLWAIRRRRAGGLTASVGLLIFLIGALVSYRMRIENGWSVGFAFLIIVLGVSLSRQMAERNRLHHEAELRSARLELDLLKKHIQPHFLLNSLNSIVAWLEEDPATAAKLVNALAEELRMLLTFSGRKTVALTEEIQLCRAHLQVMSLRQEKHYDLRVEGLTGSEALPPLVIHTLVENGLTHGYREKDHGTFVLRREQGPKGLRVSLFNDGSGGTAAAQAAEGTGTRYVKTRLEEAFPGQWSFWSGPVAGGWQATIELKKGIS